MTKDGVTVAKEVRLEDQFENMGAQMVEEVASKTSDVAGDGTTTATVLAGPYSRKAAIVAGHDPMTLKRGVDKAVAAIIKLKKLFEVNEGPRRSPGRHHLGEQRFDDQRHHRRGHERWGEEGIITIEEAEPDAAQDDQGHAVGPWLPSPYFVTDPDRIEAVLGSR